MKYKEIYACQEHVEMALDDFVDENEIFPNLDKDDNGKCHYCDKLSVYKVYYAD